MARWSVAPNNRIEFDVRYEDDDVVVVDKPGGVVTQPGKGHVDDSLLNGLFTRYAARLQNVGRERDWGLLHRLDKDTSGLVMVALRPAAYERLKDDFKSRRVKKLYWALVDGSPDPVQGVIQKPIAEVVGARKLAAIRRDGQPAVTAYKVLAGGRGVSLIEARPATGRLHQVRIHLASLGCPLLGDDIYGKSALSKRVARLCLHAAWLSFVQPSEQRRIEVSSPWPADLASVLGRYGLDPP